MKNFFEIIELLIGENPAIYGTNAISLVNDPAIERDFVHFNKEFITNLKSVDDEKRIVMGPVLVPKKMILRQYQDQHFYVHFSEDTVRKTAQRFMENGLQENVTLEHSSNAEGVVFVETWVKESMDFDKSMVYGDGFKDLPVGTWFAMARVDNDDIWADIKAQKVKGYSIEGKFTDALIQQSKVVVEPENIDTPEDLNMVQEIIRLLDNVDENATDVE